LWSLSRVLVHLWNLGITQADQWLKSKEKLVTAYSFNYWLTGARQTTISLANGTQVLLASISSDVERETLRKLAGSYQSFFELKKKKDWRARMPWTRTEERFMTLSWSSFSLENGVLSIPGSNKDRMNIPIGQYLTECIAGKDVVHATIAFRDGCFELSLVTTYPVPDRRSDSPTFFRAIDLGAGDIAITDSDGSEFLIPARRPDKFWRDKIKSLEARAEDRQKGSRGWKRLMEARRQMHDHSHHQHESHQRKLANALVEEKVHCLVIGKAVTRLGLAQTEYGTNAQHWGVQNTGYMHRQLLYLKEKAAERGVIVVELPDPIRQGNSEDPLTKFNATRTMLTTAMTKHSLTAPTAFMRKGFSFKQ
jgi:transposase